MQNLMSLKIAIPANDNCWISRHVKKFDGIFVKVIDLERNGDGSAYHLFEVLAPNRIEEVSNSLMHDRALSGVRLTANRNDRLIGWARACCAENCALARLNSCFLTSVTSGDNGEVYWHFIGTSSGCRRLMRTMTEQGVLYRVVELKILREKNIMTAKQELAVRTALDLGYFDYPKKLNIRELAEVLRISHATLNEEIRKGVKKILTMYFEEKEGLGERIRVAGGR